MYEYHTLSNGIRIILNHTASRVAYSGVYINVGSRDEKGSDEGMAHFIEHSIFKGTAHRRAYHILNRIDGVGGELNAFTTKEETCVYATSLTKDLDRCLELFADILFHSTFPEAEIEREKEVVIEEINSYRDTPSELIFDQYEELAYEGHPLSHNILGSKRNVRAFSPERLRQHMERLYTPQRMVLFCVDKGRARRDAWRIGEGALLGFSLFGGALGGLLGMLLAHHKVRTPHFRIGLPLALLLDLAVIAYLLQAGLV